MRHTTVAGYSFSMAVKQLVNVVTVSADITEEVPDELYLGEALQACPN
jgi:hypothetical protein